MNEFFAPFVQKRIPPDTNSQDLFKKMYTRALIIIGLPISAIFGIHDFLTSRFVGVLVSTVIFLVLCFLLVDTIKNSRLHRPSRFNDIVFRFLLVFLTAFLVYAVGFEQSLSSSVWFLIIPIMTFYSTNLREALIWTMCVGAVLAYFLFASDLNPSYDEIIRLKTRLLIIFSIIASVTFFGNVALRSSIQKLFDKQNELSATNLKLKNSEEKYRLIFNEAPAGIYEFDFVKDRFVTVNDVMCAYSGYTEEELLAMNPCDLLTPKSKILYAERTSAQLAGNKTSETVEYDIVTKDGRTISVILNSHYLYEGDKLTGGRVVIYDITDRKQLEEELRHARKMETIGTLSGGIAHNFNNLLMGIQGRVSLMSFDLEKRHPHWEHVDAIQEHIQSAVDLTDQLLGIASDGKIEVKPIDLNDLVLESAAMFGRTHKEIQIHTRAKSSQLVTRADRSQIEQVLLNLYLNAWQAMPGGGELSLELSTISFDEVAASLHPIEPGDYVQISITDTGIGMDEATREQIFDPFFTTKDKGRGTGLGLASAYGIVKSHGGMIMVHSEVGQGTTFNIYLPSSDEEIEQAIRPDCEIIEGSETCLLVDDEEMILEVGQALLKKLGYKPVVARSGPEAIEMVTAAGGTIDLVILDMVMPGMDGEKTFDRIREIRPEIPVMLSSGYTMIGQAQEVMKKGCNGFIQKPFSVAEFSQTVRSVLDDTKGVA
jgi:two-component system, cell cycle sensor histidine kinase and response regulator CckA